MVRERDWSYLTTPRRLTQFCSPCAHHGRGATCRPYGKDLALQLCNTPVDDLPRAIQQDVLQHSPIMSHQ